MTRLTSISILSAAFCASAATAQFNFSPSELRLDVGSPGEWNDLDVLNPQVLDAEVFSGFPKTMYYVGHGGPFGPTVPERYIVGVAKSTDGIAWHRHPTALLGWGAPGSWDDDGRIHISVVEPPVPVPAPFLMYYSASDGDEAFPTTKTNIGLATSADGLTFTKIPVPVLTVGPPGAWDDAAVFACSVLSPFDAPAPYWQMWYTGFSDRPGVPGASAGIGYATSPDGIFWIKSPAPVVSFSGGSLGGGFFYQPVVRFIEGAYHVWLTKVEDLLGTPIRSVHWYTSPDGHVGWEGPYQPHGAIRYAHEAFPQWDSAASEVALWHVRQGGGGTHPFYGVPFDNIGIATAPIYRDHPAEPYLLTSTEYYRTLPLTIALADSRAAGAPYGLLLDLVFDVPPISVPTPFGVLAVQNPVTVASGVLDPAGLTQILLPGFGTPSAVGLEVNLQAAVANAATLSDALSNPMTIYLVD